MEQTGACVWVVGVSVRPDCRWTGSIIRQQQWWAYLLGDMKESHS